MRFGRAVTAAIAVVTMSGLGIITAAQGAADPNDVDGDYSVNGAFAAMSDGQWAQLHQAFHDQPTVLSTWTITSSCTTPYKCTGTVASDQGWKADASMMSGIWFVSRELDNWQVCADGSAAPGHQLFKFYRLDATTLVGSDMTTGDSGACGTNLPLSITMPFTLRVK